MIMTALAKQNRQVARPLKILIPMIQGELQLGNAAGHDHYRRAGEMLIEAKEQVAYGAWGKWLGKNFDLSTRQAQEYMRWARSYTQIRASGASPPFASLREMRGATERSREEHRSKQQQDFRRVMRDVARDEFVQERQARDEELELHREIAEQMIDLGFRALATKLHPDRGGSKDAMARLNRVHNDCKQYARTRRFV